MENSHVQVGYPILENQKKIYIHTPIFHSCKVTVHGKLRIFGNVLNKIGVKCPKSWHPRVFQL